MENGKQMEKETIAAASGNGLASSGGLKRIVLPKPMHDGGKSVSEALKARRTTRSFSDRKLSPQMLSDLLWSACGVNREHGPFDIPGITAGSASNSQEIEVYVALEEGIYLYEPGSHSLVPMASGDLRGLALGERQGTTGSNAPVRLVFVANIEKYSTAGFQEPGLKNPETQKAYYYVDTGLIAGNVYLFAASNGLAAWFHNCNRAELAKRLKLGEHQHVLFGQTVGYEQREQTT